MSVVLPSAIVRRGFHHSLRFEVAFVLLCGVALPILVLSMVQAGAPVSLPRAVNWLMQTAAANSAVGVSLCALGVISVLRRLRFYPGVAVAKSILPVSAVAFGLLVALIAIFRLDYSTKVLATGFLGFVIARFAIAAMRSRTKGLLYCLVPGGRVGLLAELRSAPVLVLQRPSLENLPDCAIVADVYGDFAPEWERFIADAAISGRPVYHYKQVWEAETGKVQIHHLSENGFGALVPSLTYQKFKRALDVTLCLSLLPVIVPLIAVCAIAIKWDDGGKVFFHQRRMGFRGKEFDVLKLRTMSEGHNGEDRDLSITRPGDARVTRVGAILRRTRLDELPQVVNILRGEMSWIGPRPEAVGLSEWYESKIPFYRYRHIVRPGISGWAQVNQGHVSEVSEVDEKLQYDFYYVKNLSYWLDILIILRTARVVLSGFGAK